MERTKTLALTRSLASPLTIGILSFLVPFMLGHAQLPLGILVNAGLYLSVIYLSSRNRLPVIALPSTAALARGLVFGPLTLFLAYFIPAIWAGNWLLVSVFANTRKRFGFIGGVALSALVKFLFLQTAAQIYFSFHLVPKPFLVSMGVFQLVTALGGGVLAYIISKAAGKQS